MRLKKYISLIYEFCSSYDSLGRQLPEDSVMKNYINEILMREPIKMSETQTTSMDNPKTSTSLITFNLLGFILPTCLIILICQSMSQFYTKGVYRKNLAAPISRQEMKGELLLGSLCYSEIYAFFFVMASMLQSETKISQELILYSINTFLFVISICELGFFLSAYLKKKRTFMVVGNLVGVSFALISGVYIGREVINLSVLKVASLTPVYWFVEGNQLIAHMNRVSFQKLIPIFQTFGIQLVFAVTIFCMILVQGKLELNKTTSKEYYFNGNV